MPKLIKDNQVFEDDWITLTTLPEAGFPAGKLIVSLSLWIAHFETLKQRSELGLLLSSNEEPESIKDDLAHFTLVAIEFPTFSDGRGYTTARLLRERYHYKGEIRAVGDVLRDQLFYMKRCGINAFLIRENKDVDNAIEGLSDFSEVYQAGVDQPLPLFRRR